ncbi:MAG: hypothetical protein ACLQPV_03985 [Vulcanimicrobiaceae bacterium]
MLINPAISDALDRIAQRGADVMRAYTPGAVPAFDDVATPGPTSRAVLDPLSVAAPEDAYFVVSDASGERRYTRDGTFSVRGDVLVSGNDIPVLGFASETGVLAPLRVNEVDAALGRVREVRVEADGTLAYVRVAIDPLSGASEWQRVAVGRIALARFPAATRLTPAGPTTLSAPGAVLPHVGRPGDGTFRPVQAMRRERSRVDLDASLTHLQDAYLAFDALQSAQRAQGSLKKTTMDLLK